MRIATDSTADARPRVRVAGPLRHVRASGRPGTPRALRAELGDSEGPVTLVWLGRDRITGIEPGRMLAAEGTLSVQHGRKIIYNPRYDLGYGEEVRVRPCA